MCDLVGVISQLLILMELPSQMFLTSYFFVFYLSFKFFEVVVLACYFDVAAQYLLWNFQFGLTGSFYSSSLFFVALHSLERC